MLDLAQIRTAQKSIEPFIHRTPLIRSHTLSERWKTNVYLKLECWQKTGSFKPRGAFYKLLGLSEQQRRCGVVGVSGGNHAQGLAYAAKCLGLSAVICMPQSTPENYLEATRGYGAQVQLFPSIHAAFAAAEQMQQTGRIFVHPFDDPFIAAGQGTVGLEIVEDLPQVTRCYVSIGGGGLIGGIAVALKESSIDRDGTNRQIIGVETVGADVMAQTVAAGSLITLPQITSIARTLGAPRASELTYQLVRRWVDQLVVVSDAQTVRELVFTLERTKILVEPAAACCMAAAACQQAEFSPQDHVVIVLCGGNVAVSDLCGWHQEFLGKSAPGAHDPPTVLDLRKMKLS